MIDSYVKAEAIKQHDAYQQLTNVKEFERLLTEMQK
jgi:hypothetical protein